MFKGFKYRIYPDAEQEVQLRKTLGCTRLIYNLMLERKSKAWTSEKKRIGWLELSKELTALRKTEEYVFLTEVSRVCLQNAALNLDRAYSNFFAKRSAFPTFKKKHGHNSAQYETNAFRFKDGALLLAKHMRPMKVAWSRPLQGKVKNITISLTASGAWYAAFICELPEPTPLPSTDKRVGIDLGLTSFATLSTGEKVKAPNPHRRALKALKKAQREVARRKKGSKNRDKSKRKVARIHHHISNVRKDFLHKLTTKLVRENQTIALEDLNVSGMQKNRKLSRAISDQGWSEFRHMLDYKCKEKGRELVVVDRFFPSSKTCNACGKVVGKLPLSVRTWTCACGAVHDRDVNAARNILAAGHAVSACGETVRPKRSKNAKASLVEAGTSA